MTAMLLTSYSWSLVILSACYTSLQRRQANPNVGSETSALLDYLEETNTIEVWKMYYLSINMIPKLIGRMSCPYIYRSKTLPTISGWGESDLEDKDKFGQC